MKAFKGFDKNLQCRGLQYEIGGTQEFDNVKLCERGGHACEAPLDVFNYYAPGDGSRYCVVEMDGVSEERGDDSKRVAKKLTVGAEIGIPGLVKAHIEYVKAHTTMEYTDPKAATAGNFGAATDPSGGLAVSAAHRGIGAAYPLLSLHQFAVHQLVPGVRLNVGAVYNKRLPLLDAAIVHVFLADHQNSVKTTFDLYVIAARFLSMMPSSIVCTDAFSSLSAYSHNAGILSSSPRFLRAPLHAKIVAMGLVEVFSPLR